MTASEIASYAFCPEAWRLDDVTLRSERLKLVGRPDRIVRDGEYLIPEEWKSANRVSHGHRLQVVAYCLLIEETYGKRGSGHRMASS